MQNRYPIGLFSKVKAKRAIGHQLACDYGQLFRRGTITGQGFGPNGAFVTIQGSNGQFRSLSLKKMKFAEML